MVHIMKKLSAIAVLLVVLVLATWALATPSVEAKGFCFKCLFHCPKSDDYDPACLRSAIPPWPICHFHSVDDFVDHAQDSATRCCGDVTSACRCPKKNTDRFRNKIDQWCRGVASCGGGDKEQLAAVEFFEQLESSSTATVL